MKHTKKILSLVLALVLALAMAMPVMAEGSSHTLTVNSSTSGHRFGAYQVFSGTISDGKLVDFDWGTGVNKETILGNVQAIKIGEGFPFAGCKNAQDVAKVLDDNKDNSKVAEAFAKAVSGCLTGEKKESNSESSSGDGYTYTIDGLTDGYYFVKDEDTDAPAYTKFILWVTNDAKVNAKTDAPSAEKKVEENVKYPQNDDSPYGEKYGEGYNDVADYNIGDNVPFAFYSKVPNMDYYDTYKYIFHDTMDKGLTFNDDVKVTIGGKVIESGYKVEAPGIGDDSCTFEVRFENLKEIDEAVPGATVKIEFTAKLNENAELGIPGNVNKMHLEYSNNPNDESETKDTPDDKVIVFTYGLNVTKIDGATDGDNPTKLAGAEFKLYRGSGADIEYAVIVDGKISKWTKDEKDGSLLVSDGNGQFGVAGLDDGTYYLKETKAPAGYNLLKESVEVTINAETNNGQNWNETPEGGLASLNNGDGDIWKGEVTDGIVYGTISNNSGTELPSTGGIGTTIFYVIGGILVIGAAILLISKRRAGTDK